MERVPLTMYGIMRDDCKCFFIMVWLCTAVNAQSVNYTSYYQLLVDRTIYCLDDCWVLSNDIVNISYMHFMTLDINYESYIFYTEYEMLNLKYLKYFLILCHGLWYTYAYASTFLETSSQKLSIPRKVIFYLAGMCLGLVYLAI
jgi:hypothetical protein